MNDQAYKQFIIEMSKQSSKESSDEKLITVWEQLQIDLDLDEKDDPHQLSEPVNNIVEVELETRGFNLINNQWIKKSV